MSFWICISSVWSQARLGSFSWGDLAMSLIMHRGLKRTSVLCSPSNFHFPSLRTMTTHAAKSFCPLDFFFINSLSFSCWFSTVSIPKMAENRRMASMLTISHFLRVNRAPVMAWGRGLRRTIIPYLWTLEKSWRMSMPTIAAQSNEPSKRAVQWRRWRRRGGSVALSFFSKERYKLQASLWRFQCFPEKAKQRWWE